MWGCVCPGSRRPGERLGDRVDPIKQENNPNNRNPRGSPQEKGWWGRWVSHFLDDSPTTGLAACQVPRGLLGSATLSRVVEAGTVSSEGPLKAPHLSDWVSLRPMERLWVKFIPSKLGCSEAGHPSQAAIPSSQNSFFLLLGH